MLDAAFLIAFLDAGDDHHEAARDLLVVHAERELAMSPIDRAEVLVGPTGRGQLDDVSAVLGTLAIEDVALPVDAAERLAELRVITGSKMPDCCVLLAAQQRSAAVATFDGRLRTWAESIGLRVLS